MVVMRKRKRNGLFTLALLALVLGLCYVVLVQPPLVESAFLLGVALTVCVMAALKGD